MGFGGKWVKSDDFCKKIEGYMSSENVTMESPKIFNWSTFNLVLIVGLKSLFISYPIEFRPKFFAAKHVVPLPKNGSKTVSPTNENILISHFGISSGNIAMCSTCRVPVMFQCDEKHCFHSSIDSFDASFCSGVGFGAFPGFLKSKIYS